MGRPKLAEEFQKIPRTVKLTAAQIARVEERFGNLNIGVRALIEAMDEHPEGNDSPPPKKTKSTDACEKCARFRRINPSYNNPSCPECGTHK